MCEEPATAETIRAAAPAAAPGGAVDPITLKPVEEVVVTTLVDNVYDALLDGQETITRAPFAAGIAQAPQFESGTTRRRGKHRASRPAAHRRTPSPRAPWRASPQRRLLRAEHRPNRRGTHRPGPRSTRPRT